MDVFLAGQSSAARAHDHVIGGRLEDAETLRRQIVAGFVKGDLVPCCSRAVEQFCHLSRIRGVSMFGHDDLRHRRAVFHRAAGVHVACVDLGRLSIPQPLDAERAVVVHLERRADGKKQLRQILPAGRDGQPAI